jgi:hypothetical protein
MHKDIGFQTGQKQPASLTGFTCLLTCGTVRTFRTLCEAHKESSLISLITVTLCAAAYSHTFGEDMSHDSKNSSWGALSHNEEGTVHKFQSAIFT